MAIDSGPNVEQVITQAARAMTAGEAPRDMRARVLDRLDRASEVGAWRLLAAAAAGIAVAAVGFGLMRDGATVGVPTATQVTDRSVPTPIEPPTLPTEPTAPARPRSLRQMARPSLAELEWRARAIPALPPIDALAIDAIQPAALTIPLLEVRPLATEAEGRF